MNVRICAVLFGIGVFSSAGAALSATNAVDLRTVEATELAAVRGACPAGGIECQEVAMDCAAGGCRPFSTWVHYKIIPYRTRQCLAVPTWDSLCTGGEYPCFTVNDCLPGCTDCTPNPNPPIKSAMCGAH